MDHIYSVFKCIPVIHSPTRKSVISTLIKLLMFGMKKPPHYLLIPLCVFRTSTYLFISVCCTGSVREPRQGENTEINSQRAPYSISAQAAYYYSL